MTGQPKTTSSAANGRNDFSKASSASKSAIAEYMQVLNDAELLRALFYLNDMAHPDPGNVSRFKIIDSTLREVIFSSNHT
jgi:hypothetical protein